MPQYGKVRQAGAAVAEKLIAIKRKAQIRRRLYPDHGTASEWGRGQPLGQDRARARLEMQPNGSWPAAALPGKFRCRRAP